MDKSCATAKTISNHAAKRAGNSSKNPAWPPSPSPARACCRRKFPRRKARPVVSIILDKTDALTALPPVRWAAEQLRDALNARGLAAEIYPSFQDAPTSREYVLVAGKAVRLARSLLDAAGAKLAAAPEALALARGKVGKHSILLAAGADARGMVYALLEIADRVKYADDALDTLRAVKPVSEQPANSIRSIARGFNSDVEDKSWFQDRNFWPDYLTMLAANRFNRFNLTLGLGYDFARELRDTYFYFAYPFLLSVPGHDVRAVPLPDAERDLNLAMLRFISDESARRGLHFQLGIWTHAYQWADSPDANYTITGLTPETHAAYCRDALRALLAQCPAIGGVTFRVHGESGVAEGSYDFWKTVFDGAAQCGRKVEIDMHAKGMDQPMIDVALGTGLPVIISPKFWAEHMGLPYMQGAIRPQEMPRENSNTGFFSRSSGARSFLRYGYGDLLAEDRRYQILHRIWPGTQRLLLWGDPQMAAGYGRVGSFCGSNGVEIFEPLFFKGRKGSGLPGGRDAYADDSLRPKIDFEKYDYTYRVWGRNLYNPDGDADGWERAANKQFGKGAESANFALALASRILPLVTTAHCPSAANNNYWPEMYFNLPIVDPAHKNPYSDTPAPKRLGNVSPLDPEFFLGVDEFAGELLKGEAGGKFSPAWVANQLDDGADAAFGFLTRSASQGARRKKPGIPPARRGCEDSGWTRKILRREIPRRRALRALRAHASLAGAGSGAPVAPRRARRVGRPRAIRAEHLPRRRHLRPGIFPARPLAGPAARARRRHRRPGNAARPDARRQSPPREGRSENWSSRPCAPFSKNRKMTSRRRCRISICRRRRSSAANPSHRRPRAAPGRRAPALPARQSSRGVADD